MQKKTYYQSHAQPPPRAGARPAPTMDGCSSAHAHDRHLHNLFPIVMLMAMECAVLLLDAVLPLQGLGFHDIQLSQLSPWFLLPTHLLFPGWATTPPVSSGHIPPLPAVALSWAEFPLLLMALLSVFLLYLLALRRLPQRITRNYILYSTLLLGITCILIPVVTSPDVYSYISYARMGVIYHLNPLTTLPTAIRTDPTYMHIYWIDQPSAYGPTWAILSSILQECTLIFGAQNIVPMVLALRLFGLAMHLGSTLLIWFIIGYLQRLDERITPVRRILATLAFAWNPLLLFEACINAHNDAALLFFILLAIWFLLPRTSTTSRTGILQATVVLALATCLKINAILLVPMFLIFVWKFRSIRSTLLPIFIYIGIIILFYAPFWQNGAILNVVHANPTTSRNINSVPEFLSQLYNGITGALGAPVAQSSSSPAETFSHSISIGIFVILYAMLGWRAMRTPHAMSTLPSLIRWLALTWLLYCAVGTPWFWPWYTVTFFGLYALVEGMEPSWLTTNLPIRILAFSMLGIYCFSIWGPRASSIPGLPGFEWAYLRSLWAWTLPILALGGYLKPSSIVQRYAILMRKRVR